MDKKLVVFDLWYTLIYLPNGWKTFNHLRRDFDIDLDFWRANIKPLFLCNQYREIKDFLADFQKTVGYELDVEKQGVLMERVLASDIS